MTKITGADLAPEHFDWNVDGKVGTLTINRPDRKNPLTFQSYAEIRDTFRALRYADDVKTVVSRAPAAISARAATFTTSSAR